MKLVHKVDHAAARARMYPKVGDQLDAVYKMATALRAQGIELPSETLNWLDQVAAVKAKIPKPVG